MIHDRLSSEPTNDGDLVLGGLELPEGNIDGDTTLTLGLEFVKNPCVLERTLAELGSFLQESMSATDHFGLHRAMTENFCWLGGALPRTTKVAG